MLFEDTSFGARANNLQNQHRTYQQEQVRALEEEKESREDQDTKDIDWIADARVDAVCDQLRGLGLHREGIAELEARNGQENESRNHEKQSRNPHVRPRGMRKSVDDVGDAQDWHDGDHEGAAFHCFASFFSAHDGSAFQASERGREFAGLPSLRKPPMKWCGTFCQSLRAKVVGRTSCKRSCIKIKMQCDLGTSQVLAQPLERSSVSLGMATSSERKCQESLARDRRR